MYCQWISLFLLLYCSNLFSFLFLFFFFLYSAPSSGRNRGSRLISISLLLLFYYYRFCTLCLFHEEFTSRCDWFASCYFTPLCCSVPIAAVLPTNAEQTGGSLHGSFQNYEIYHTRTKALLIRFFFFFLLIQSRLVNQPIKAVESNGDRKKSKIKKRES